MLSIGAGGNMVVCPRCGNAFVRLPIVSIKDESTLLCIGCGLLEVFERDAEDSSEKVCPKCGRTYKADAVISVLDNKTKLCPVCAALEAGGIDRGRD